MLTTPLTLKTGILILFFGWASLLGLHAQSLHLKVLGQTQNDTVILDSLDYQQQFSDLHTLQAETRSIAASIIRLGYLESELKAIDKINDSSFIARYHLGNRYLKARIYYKSNFDKNILNTIAHNVTNTYFEVEIENLEQALQHLNTEISNTIDPFSTLQLEYIQKKDRILTANLIITKTAARTIDTIIIKGYEKFPQAFMKRYLKIKRKQPFNLKTIKQKTTALEHLGFASQLKDPEVLFTKDSTLLFFYIDKLKSNSFDGFLGFGTNTQTNKIEFDGYLNLNLVNNLNYGESLRLLYKSDESSQKTFDVTAKLPYVLQSPIGVQLGLNIFKKDSSFVTTSQTAKLDYQINPKNGIDIGIDIQSSTNLLDRPLLTINDFKSRFYTVGYHHVQPQYGDLLFPINLEFHISGGTGKRTIENLSQSQTKFNADLSKIFNLNARNSIYGKVSAAMLNSNEVIENELFRFGGINSIRGFEENSLVAHLFGVFNTEYRYKVTNSLYVNTIFDLAYYENKLFDTKHKLMGFGLGFGVLTQAGLLKLNYSNGRTEQQPIKLSNSKIHISLTSTF